MANATWENVDNSKGFKVRKATINSTDTQTAPLPLDSRVRSRTITIEPGSGESAIQIKGHSDPLAVEARLGVLAGASAISSFFEDTVAPALAQLQVTGATTANNTVITVTEVV